MISVFESDFLAPDISLDIMLSFPPGSVDGDVDCVTVDVIDDDLLEADEQFFVTLSSPTGGANLAAPSMANVVILDNEGELLVQFTHIHVMGSEMNDMQYNRPRTILFAYNLMISFHSLLYSDRCC